MSTPSPDDAVNDRKRREIARARRAERRERGLPEARGSFGPALDDGEYGDRVYLWAPVAGPHGFVSAGEHACRIVRPTSDDDDPRLVIALPSLLESGAWVERELVVRASDVERRSSSRARLFPA